MAEIVYSLQYWEKLREQWLRELETIKFFMEEILKFKESMIDEKDFPFLVPYIHFIEKFRNSTIKTCEKMISALRTKKAFIRLFKDWHSQGLLKELKDNIKKFLSHTDGFFREYRTYLWKFNENPEALEYSKKLKKSYEKASEDIKKQNEYFLKPLINQTIDVVMVGTTIEDVPRGVKRALKRPLCIAELFLNLVKQAIERDIDLLDSWIKKDPKSAVLWKKSIERTRQDYNDLIEIEKSNSSRQGLTWEQMIRWDELQKKYK